MAITFPKLGQTQQKSLSQPFGGTRGGQSAKPPGGFGKMQLGGSSGSGLPGSFNVGGSGRSGGSRKLSNAQQKKNPFSANANKNKPFSPDAAKQNKPGGASNAPGGNPGNLQAPVGDFAGENGILAITPGVNAANPGTFTGINSGGDDKHLEVAEEQLDKLIENREEWEEKQKEAAEKAQEGGGGEK